jgi:hypothetical protein
MFLRRKHIGNISVESGRLILIDPLHLKSWNPGEHYPEVPMALNHYDEAQKAAAAEPWYGRMLDDSGVVVSPAEGDGTYPVYGFFTDEDLLVKISVVMGVEGVEAFDRPAWERRDEDDEYVLDPATGSEIYVEE